MPSTSASQHRFFGWLHSNPAARKAHGISAAKVDEWLHADRGSPWKKADGGGLSPPAIARYASLPTDKLQAKAKLLDGTPQGAVAQSLLKDRPAPKLAEGFLSGGTLGRADAVRTEAPNGSYIIPADIVGHWGEGNSGAGARVWSDILENLTDEDFPVSRAHGGEVGGPHVPVLLSDGEIAVHPRDVMRIGHGNMKRGHRVLDRLMLRERAKHIKKLKSLPGPVKS